MLIAWAINLEKNEAHFATDPDVQSKSHWSHRAIKEFQSLVDLIAFNLYWKTCLWVRTSKQQCYYGNTSSEYIKFSRLILEIRCLSNAVHTWFPLFDWLVRWIWIVSSCSRWRLFLISSRNLWFPFYFVGQHAVWRCRTKHSRPVRPSKVGPSWYSFICFNFFLIDGMAIKARFWDGSLRRRLKFGIGHKFKVRAICYAIAVDKFWWDSVLGWVGLWWLTQQRQKDWRFQIVLKIRLTWCGFGRNFYLECARTGKKRKTRNPWRMLEK